MATNNPNAGIAFALVCGAGLSTALGAAVVFFPSLVKLASRRVLAASLGLSAGVMTYVSFVEILFKSQDSFLSAGHDEDRAFLFATICFFSGVFLMSIIDMIVHCLAERNHHHHAHSKSHEDHHGSEVKREPAAEKVTPYCIGCIEDPIAELEDWQEMADEEVEDRKKQISNKDNCTVSAISDIEDVENLAEGNVSDINLKNTDAEGDDVFLENDGCVHPPKTSSERLDTPNSPLEIENSPDEDKKEENRELNKMGLTTALAIGLHNFPEGLATFIAALDDPQVGFVLAVAIGIHNIPEGLCVSLPIYYATGNRWKGFLWALLSGLSEPIAALLGWAILARSFSDNMFAILFGIVSGMMVMISLKELLPTAHRYDPRDTVVTNSFIFGMTVMAVSLVLFRS